MIFTQLIGNYITVRVFVTNHLACNMIYYNYNYCYCYFCQHWNRVL